jgi:hypothetical protein
VHVSTLLTVIALLLMPSLASAQTVTWQYDAVTGGTCKKFVERWKNTGVHASDGTNNPGKWAVTKSTLFLGDKAADSDEAVNNIAFVEKVKPKNAKNQICVAWTKVNFNFRAEHQITALEWKHSLKPDSKCAKEWERVRGLIQAHEPRHVQDVDAIVVKANTRGQKMAAITGCGANVTAARNKAAQALSTKLQAAVEKIKSDAEKKAQELDAVSTADMTCPCKEKLAFSGIDLFCDIKTPACTIRSGQRFKAEVCGDPLTGTWSVTPTYYTTGCGMPAGNPQANKPFDNDCVAAGSAEETRRANIYKAARSTGGGGWMCVYSDGPTPKVTIRSFRTSTCETPAEQTVTVDVENKGACE